jgi:hypothetical protein
VCAESVITSFITLYTIHHGKGRKCFGKGSMNMTQPIQSTVREILLTVIHSQKPRPNSGKTLQERPVLEEARQTLPGNVSDQEILTQWHELFRTGLVAWGLNITNPNHPFST